MAESEEIKRLQCLEVWGGNRFVSTSVVLPGMDAWIYSMPADGAESVGGGDVHYVSSCAAGALTRLLVADVCGHGAQASATAHRLRKMMQFHVNFHTQTRFVRALNQEFSALAKTERFATAVAFTYDAPINKLLVCNAGHPLPLVYRGRDQTWSPLDSPGGNLPLGIDDVAYEQFEAPIKFGDLVLCYTDAMLECRKGNDMLGQKGLLDLLKTLDPSSPETFIQQLTDAMNSAGWKFDDDLTLLVFRPNGSRQHIAWWEHAVIPFRMMKWVWKVLSPANPMTTMWRLMSGD
jgi:serine phosphatase RsbU (regulator of sigma subunit)